MERGWRIELLGELRVWCGDEVGSRFPKQLAASMLACLACHPQHRHARDALLEALCPELALLARRRDHRPPVVLLVPLDHVSAVVAGTDVWRYIPLGAARAA